MSLFKKAHSLIVKLFSTGFFHIFGGSVVNKAVHFLSSVVLVRILTKHEYGVFTYAWNIYSFIILLNGMGMEHAVLQCCSENSRDEKLVSSISGYGTRFGLIFDAFVTLVILFVGLFIPLNISGANDILLLLCILPIVVFLSNTSMIVLRVQKRNKDYSVLSIMSAILMFAFSVAGAYLFREKGLIAGHYVAGLATFLCGLLFFKVNLFSKHDDLSVKHRKTMQSIAFVSMCNNALAQLMYLIDVFVLGIVLSDEMILASYKAATIIPSALTFVPVSVVTYLYPYFAENMQNKKLCLKNAKKVYLGMGLMNAAISITLFIAAPLIIDLLYGNSYADAVPIFRILSINYFFSGTFRVMSGNLLITQRKIKFNFWVGLISGCVNIIADVFFIQWWGSMGAALATVLVVLISGAMSTIYLFYQFKK